MATHWLSEYVHICATADHLVLLDLRNDRYLAVPTSHSKLLGPYVHGWPVEHDALLDPDNSITPGLVASLEERGLLTRDESKGKPAGLESAVAAPQALIDTILLYTLDPGVPRPRQVRVSEIFQFAISYLVARRTLSSNQLESRVNRTRARKSRAQHASNDLEDLKRRLTSFRLIRPFFYTSQDKCLLDAIVLTEYLARYNHFPSWVFGVQTRPFAAHCWVQTTDFVLNDVPEHVETFTTIMSV